MFRYIRDPLFVVCTVLCVVNRWLVKLRPAFGEAFFRSYLNDLLLIPYALPPMLFLHRHLSLRPHDSFPTRSEVMLHLVVWSLYCEWVGPVIQHQGIGDPLDVLAYWIGGIEVGHFGIGACYFTKGRKEARNHFSIPPVPLRGLTRRWSRPSTALALLRSARTSGGGSPPALGHKNNRS
jgi:hypothetical protein